MLLNIDFSDRQKRRSLLLLSLFHIFILAISNYLVQLTFEIKIPFTDLAIPTTWGTFSFPFIFLATDLTVRVFGTKLARRIIFLVMFPALIVSYIMSVIFFEAQFQGFNSLANFNFFVFRIALASFTAYIIGQLMDIFIFNKLRQKSRWWIAPTSSTLFGSLIDTLVFFAVAFYQCADPYLAEHWFDLGIVDYFVKISVSMALFLPLYGVLLTIIIKRFDLATAE
ncbi:7-cyano-7-deazaguanine/7-aminomethyl-7-deazaguanine transporter [Phocoenobacter atlanticus]|uniref:7-cyano-7-deazaguanine/7-aminomethyl-7- deazaguanine transporter n=1 Tax=Phocoenobacter atlanticus TaxID=3416742 RepID=UPI002771C267|nr:7-cyano-7-deazaguanine/7-aminomethyl-7-deazaguanine transporter [Pasteurella atlantica]MDP8101420.1 7-cyano-7-deazaguanine/7-aminomethyl-7-deazaguanine transporter [Pasteurella atlantica]